MGPSLVLEGYHSLGLCEEYPERRFYVGSWNRISSTSRAVASAIGAIWSPDVLTSERVKSLETTSGPQLWISAWVCSRFTQRAVFAKWSQFFILLLRVILYFNFFKSWHHSNFKQGSKVDQESWERRICHFPSQFTQLMGDLFFGHHISAVGVNEAKSLMLCGPSVWDLFSAERLSLL